VSFINTGDRKMNSDELGRISFLIERAPKEFEVTKEKAMETFSALLMEHSEMKEHIRKISVMISKVFPMELTYVDDIQALREIFDRYARLYRVNIEKDQLIFEAMSYMKGQNEKLYNAMLEMNDDED
jgi:hypothetical protein